VENAPGFAPPVFDEAPLLAEKNLSNIVDGFKRGSLGVKSCVMKTVQPINVSTISTDPHIIFRISTNKHEWIKLNRNSISMVVFTTVTNRTKDAAQPATTEQGADRHATRAAYNNPGMFLDPSVQGTSFFERVEVAINNVPCPTNRAIDEHLLHYVSCCRKYNRKPDLHFVKTTDFEYGRLAGGVRRAPSQLMKAATKAFDYDNEWNVREGNRIPVNLDGIWPFCHKNATLESVDNVKEPNLYFPPDTVIDIRLLCHRTKMEGLFHPGIASFDGYFDPEEPGGDIAAWDIKLALQDCLLTYESVELRPEQQVIALNRFLAGEEAFYHYDIARGQHQNLPHGLSFTENQFQVMPYCRLAYVLFLPSWAVTVARNSKKPISALSRFPENCSKMMLGFAGESNLIADVLEDFGNPENPNRVSKHIYYDYLRKHGMTGGSYDDWFPRGTAATGRSLIQALVVDLRPYSSQKVERFRITCQFGAGQNQASPKDTVILLITVHPNGQAVCQYSTTNSLHNYNWQFVQKN
jgi:hypothetical protein